MGWKKVCFRCRIAFNLHSSQDTKQEFVCPRCSGRMELMPHRFRPPKKSDVQAWEAVKYLVENGFKYHHVIEVGDNGTVSFAPYPNTKQKAKNFIEKYWSQRKPKKLE